MEELDVQRILQTIWNKKPFIIFITALVMAIAGVYSYKLQKPKYKASTTLVLVKAAEAEEGVTSVTSTDLAMNQKLVSTYSEIVKSKNILSRVISNLNIQGLTEEELKDKITVESVKDTEVIKITVIDDNPEHVAIIANEIGRVFSNKVSEMYKLNNVYTLDMAEPAEEPYNIQHEKYLIISCAIGIVISCAYIVVKEIFNTTVRSSEEIEDLLKIPVVAQIPLAQISTKGGRKSDK